MALYPQSIGVPSSSARIVERDPVRFLVAGLERYCCDVLGRYDILGNDADYVIREHETDCRLAQQNKREKNAILKIEQQVLVKIINVCSLSNDYRYAKYMFQKEPAPHHKDNPDSHEFMSEKEWNETKLDTMSDKLVATWQELKELRESSEVAKKSLLKLGGSR